MKDFCLEDFSRDNGEEKLISSLCKGAEIDINVSYASDFRSAKCLREIVDNVCRWYWVDPKWRTRLVLIIDELNNNAIEYGSKKWDINYLSLKLSRKKEWNLDIYASVRDTWNWPHAKKADEMEKLRESHRSKDFKLHHSIRGRGLFLIISQLVDELTFMDAENGWLIVEIRKSLQ